MLSNCCCCSVVKSCLTPCDPVDCSTPGSSVLHYLSKFAQVHVHWVSNAIYISSFVVPFFYLQSFSASGSFPESDLHIRWPKYWSFSFSISPSNGYSVLISFRIDWIDLSAVQGTLKSLFQHHTLKAFFTVQFSHLYMTTEKNKTKQKTLALTIQNFVHNVMSPLFNILSRFVIAFLTSSKHLLT